MGEVHYKMEIFLSKSNQFHELMATDAKDFETDCYTQHNIGCHLCTRDAFTSEGYLMQWVAFLLSNEVG
ncbi:hypothetical protein CY35_14G040300 [Sphagnum magellanicum]|nr:hypothetical protein CY35_14G040300 [Sphagnum magellanicum]